MTTEAQHLGEAVPDTLDGYIDARHVAYLSDALDRYERLLLDLEPMSELKFGETEEAYRQGAKETLLAAALTIEHHRGLLTEAKRRVVSWLDEITLDGELVDLDEVGRFRVGDSAKVTYDNARTASSFAARLTDEAFDQETGEVPPLGVTIELAVTETAKALGGFGVAKTWNKGPLRERGLDPESFVVSRERTDRKLMEDR